MLTDAEIKLYLENCRQPWKDAAALILGAGMRPGEVYGLRWEFVLLNGHGGLIQVSEGKSKAARRILPMIPDVYDALKARHEQQGRPAQGWVFPSSAKCGHLEQGTAKTQHSAALAKANAAAIKDKLLLPLKAFEPYVMRHTALTRMAPFCDPFTLARIAGHSSIDHTAILPSPSRCSRSSILEIRQPRRSGHRWGSPRKTASSDAARAAAGKYHGSLRLGGERGRNRTFNLLIKSHPWSVAQYFASHIQPITYK